MIMVKKISGYRSLNFLNFFNQAFFQFRIGYAQIIIKIFIKKKEGKSDLKQ